MQRLTLVLKSVEDLSLPEPSVTMSFVDSDKGVTIDIDISKDKFLNLSGVLDSFNQVCLGLEPTLAEEGYAEPSRLEPSSQTKSPAPSTQRKAAEPATQKKEPAPQKKEPAPIAQKKAPAPAKLAPVAPKPAPAKAGTVPSDEDAKEMDLAAELDAIVKDARSKPKQSEAAEQASG